MAVQPYTDGVFLPLLLRGGRGARKALPLPYLPYLLVTETSPMDGVERGVWRGTAAQQASNNNKHEQNAPCESRRRRSCVLLVPSCRLWARSSSNYVCCWILVLSFGGGRGWWWWVVLVLGLVLVGCLPHQREEGTGRFRSASVVLLHTPILFSGSYYIGGKERYFEQQLRLTLVRVKPGS